MSGILVLDVFFFFKQKTAYEMRISDWSSDVCSSDLHRPSPGRFLKYAMDGKRAIWPDQVPVTPTAPVPRIIGPQMVATWVGHSTVLVQTAGLNILTDPIWSERASPVSFIGPKRVREQIGRAHV